MNEEIRGPHTHLEEATIAGLQAAMTSGELTAYRLAQMYIERISALDRQGPGIKSILEINPEALEIARTLDDPEYLTAHDECRRLSRQEGIDAVMDQHQLDALVMPTSSPPWLIDLVNGDPPLGGSAQPAALAGYPAINVPAGYIFDLPVGITFMGRAFSEPTLIKLAYAFEQGTKARRPPPTVPAHYTRH